METHAPREINNVKQWAYFAPDGHLQVRSIADTKKDAKDYIRKYDYGCVTHKDYENRGYVLKQIEITVKIL